MCSSKLDGGCFFLFNFYLKERLSMKRGNEKKRERANINSLTDSKLGLARRIQPGTRGSREGKWERDAASWYTVLPLYYWPRGHRASVCRLFRTMNQGPAVHTAAAGSTLGSSHYHALLTRSRSSVGGISGSESLQACPGCCSVLKHTEWLLNIGL